MFELPQPEELPSWFHYPDEFLRAARQCLVDLTPWHLMEREAVLTRIKGLRDRYPERELVPFARRQDNDDVACWERDREPVVVVVHDFSSPGSETRAEYADFWAWFRVAVEDMASFDD